MVVVWSPNRAGRRSLKVRNEIRRASPPALPRAASSCTLSSSFSRIKTGQKERTTLIKSTLVTTSYP